MDGWCQHYRKEEVVLMSLFDSGVSRYVTGSATVRVFFPVDRKGVPDVCCKQCRFFRQQSRICGLNGEIVAYPDHYVGQNCPLEMEKENENI